MAGSAGLMNNMGKLVHPLLALLVCVIVTAALVMAILYAANVVVLGSSELMKAMLHSLIPW